MSRHLLVVSEKKIKMLKTLFVIVQGEVLYNNFWRMTHLDCKHVHIILGLIRCTMLVAMLCTFDRNGFSHHVANTIGGATV